MSDSQDLMNRELRFKTTAEERKIIKDRLNKFTTLKRGVATTSLQSNGSDDNRGSAGLSPFKRTVLDTPIHSCRTSLNSNLNLNGGQK